MSPARGSATPPGKCNSTLATAVTLFDLAFWCKNFLYYIGSFSWTQSKT